MDSSVCLEPPLRRAQKASAADPALLRQLAGLGNNLNQIARAVNTQGLRAIDRVQVLAALHGVERELARLRREL